MAEAFSLQAAQGASHLLGLLADYMRAEGSIRPVDAVIAAQALNATLNAAADLDAWVRGVEPHEAAALYARPMLMGVFRD